MCRKRAILRLTGLTKDNIIENCPFIRSTAPKAFGFWGLGVVNTKYIGNFPNKIKRLARNFEPRIKPKNLVTKNFFSQGANS